MGSKPITCILAALAFTVLNTACNPASARATARAESTNAAATRISQERLPTLEAMMTAFAGTATSHPPGFEATATAGVATANALATSSTQVTLDPEVTIIWPTIEPALTPIATSTPLPPVGGYDGGDQHDTVAIYTIASGEIVSGQILKVFDAHNWLFEGLAGQIATVQANGQNGSDPQIMLLDPAGKVLILNDDGGGGYNAHITYTLPSSGTYTVRVTAWVIGPYVLTLIVE